jgi:hypothetical protein
MKKPLVAILGCGPSGLLAAHACASRGIEFVIFSKKVPSILGGAQFGHITIPGLTSEEPEAMLRYEVYGDSETYRQKVYGDAPVPFVSMEMVKDGMEVPAWNLRGLYEELWEKYSNRITNVLLDPLTVEKITDGLFGIIFSSVPLPIICWTRVDPMKSHAFRQQTIRVYNEALNGNLRENTIVYDGTRDHSYYRMSLLFGTGSTEWGASSPTPPLPNLKTINKPVATNCDCHPHVTRIGRFGTWEKGELTMHAYNRVIDTLALWGIE